MNPDGRPNYDLVIFDLDGTLIDSKLDLANSVNFTRQQMGLPVLEHQLIFSYIGDGATMLIRRAMGEGLDDLDVQRALEVFLSHYREHLLDNTTLYPGVAEALGALYHLKLGSQRCTCLIHLLLFIPSSLSGRCLN